ncbi:hypothetical protein NGB58_04010 [Escherichia coli]|nr:hypothetical protein [Escherichia coli]
MSELFLAVKGALIFTGAWILLMTFLTWKNPFRYFTPGFIVRIFVTTVAIVFWLLS